MLELPKNDFDLKEGEQNTVGLIIKKKKEEEEHVLSLHKCPSLLEERVYNRTLPDESVHTDVKPKVLETFVNRYWLFYQRRKMNNM